MFAAGPIPRRAHIVEYKGELISQSESARREERYLPRGRIWIFNINRAAENYLFVVFMTNKIIGIFLLPFLVLIAFSGSFLIEVGITLSLIMISLFYVYRFIAAYSTLHKEIKISGLYFFLYLCAFEIAPLLLIYKVLVNYLEKAY